MNYPILFTALLGLLVTACTKETKESEQGGANKTAGMPAMGMEMMNPWATVEIAKSNPTVMLNLAGELKPDQQTALFAKVNSYVKNIRVDIGDRVSPGQVLVVLEAPEIQSQLAGAKSKLEAQEAIYLSTKATYDRTLQANQTPGAISKEALDQITARKRSDEAQLNVARSAYNEIRNITGYLVLKAPFGGTITARNVDLGAYVGPMNKEPLLVIENNLKLRLSVSIPEANTPYIRVGDTLHFYVRSQPQVKQFAIVKRKSGSLDVKLRSERIEADFTNKTNTFKPHMVAETAIPLRSTEATFFVPKSAVVETGMGVYLIRVENGITQNVPVTKGRMMPEVVEVFGALNPGDKILKTGSEEIQEGTKTGGSGH